MQRPDPEKRRQIMAVAARLFAARPFHEVTLDTVAAAARIGKGTVYVYFAGKDELYGALLQEGFRDLIADLRRRLATPGRALDDLAVIVRALLEYARAFPHLFQLMRAGEQLPGAGDLAAMRQSLMDLVGEVVRRGVRSGDLRDAHPELTAAFVPALVRAAVLYGPGGQRLDTVAERILTFVGHGIAADRPRRRAPTRKRRSQR
jgi:AcrR family transcriptional regulator